MGQRSIQGKFLRMAAPLALAPVLLLALWGAHQTHGEQIARLDAKLNHLVQNQTIVLARALAENNDRLVKLTAAGLIADLDVVYVRVEDASGAPIVNLGARAESGATKSRQVLIPVEGGGLAMGGRLAIGVTYAAADKAYFFGQVIAGLEALATFAAIWLSGVVAFRNAVGRPLGALRAMIQRWRAGAPIARPDRTAKDEIGALTTAFVDLYDRVAARESELRAIKDTLEVSVAERTSELAHLAAHDELTGLANRMVARERIEVALRVAQGRCCEAALLVIDLDHFKEVNDTLGHAAGDHVLKTVAARIKSMEGPRDVAARMGGDEFVLISRASSSAEHMEKARRLIAAVTEPIDHEGRAIRIGASVGVAIADKSAPSVETILINADIALYAAKRDGRGVARRFEAEMGARYRERRALVEDVAQAARCGAFEPYFQPQIALASGAVIGIALLARRPRGPGVVATPGVFLSAADEAGVTAEIDRTILGKGLDALVAMRLAGYDARRVSVNASSASLRTRDFSEIVLAALAARGLAPSDLVVEILEETLIEDENDVAAEQINRLHVAGVIVDLDDFGAGFAALSNLARLPLSAIKLDRSLVAPLPGGPSEKIVRAMIALAAELDMRVIAEGVETEAQRERLLALGCPVAQGYAFGRPMAYADALAWLDARAAADATLSETRRA